MPKGSFEASKTHCPQGHAYDEQNTRVSKGSRFCRRCDSDRAKAKRRAGGRVIVWNRDKTHCPRGHAYDEANTRVFNGMRFCRACDLKVHVDQDNARPELMMWRSAKARAKRDNVPFSIRPEDIIIPPCCPVLGAPLRRKSKEEGRKGPGEYSPSLDRIRPAIGYVPGNIVVISHRANRIKNDATLEELKRVAAWLETTIKNEAT